MDDYEVSWQEYEAPPVGGKRGSWIDHTEAFVTSDEALDFMLMLREGGARKITMRRMEGAYPLL
jgi:hypothetical protein